ncbi:MAG: protoporphyrinogen oxidase [Pseudomonadota bacterium]
MIKPAPSTQQEVDVLIVGAGISGLSTARWLAQSGLRVQLWEKSAMAGGKIKSDHKDGFLTEQAASMIMNFKPEVDQFFLQSGLDKLKTQRLLTTNSKRYLIHQGKLQALPMTIGGLFSSSLWSSAGKFRLLMEPFIAKSQNSNESVSEFIKRRFGHEFLEKAMEPFIAGTLASDPDLACATQVIPRLTALEKRYGSITAGIIAHKILGKRTARNPDAFSFKGGMQTLVSQLASDPMLDLQTNIDVLKIIQHNTKKQYPWEVHAQSNQGDIACRAKHVVISTPAQTAARLTQPLNQALSELLASIKYVPLSVVHIGLQRSAIQHPLDSIGFLVSRSEKNHPQKVAINGNLWMSSAFSDRAPKDQVLLSSYLGGAQFPDAINLSSQQSIDQVLKDIAPLLGISPGTTALMERVDKHQYALPLYHGKYLQKLNAIKQQLNNLPALHLQANYQGGVSIRDRIVQSKKLSEEIIYQLSNNHADQAIYQNNSYVYSSSVLKLS